MGDNPFALATLGCAELAALGGVVHLDECRNLSLAAPTKWKLKLIEPIVGEDLEVVRAG